MLKRFRVAFSVATMAIENDKVDEVREDQAARCIVEGFDRLIDRLLVVLRRQILSDTHRVVNRRDLPDTNNVKLFIFKRGQEVLAWRWHGVIVAILSTIKRSRLAQERTRDHTPDLVLAIEYAPRDLTNLIKPIESYNFLMRSNLKNRVGRGVDDGLAGFDVLFAKLLDDLRS